MSDTALFASALTALIDGVQDGGRADSSDTQREWRWDAVERRWQQRQPALDTLAQHRALLLAATGAEVPHTPRRIKAPMSKNAVDIIERNGLVVGPDNTWVQHDGRPPATDLDDVVDIDTAGDEELPLSRISALAPGAALVSSFRCAQDHHRDDMRLWFSRPDGNGAQPDTDDDILAQLLKLADQQTQTLLVHTSTTS